MIHFLDFTLQNYIILRKQTFLFVTKNCPIVSYNMLNNIQQLQSSLKNHQVTQRTKGEICYWLVNIRFSSNNSNYYRILCIFAAKKETIGNGAEDKNKSAEKVEAVDLGLSVKWANMNVGAKKSSGYGTYFAWGETQPKEYYSWNTYAWSKGDSQFLTKYSTIDKRFQLAPVDDAANANWGGKWRMPTAEECKWEWITKDGVNGYKITGKRTGNSIFLPITGFRFYADTQFRGIKGIYWTSSLYTGNVNKAWCLQFDFSDVNVDYGNLSSNRFSGRCIRAVQ